MTADQSRDELYRIARDAGEHGGTAENTEGRTVVPIRKDDLMTSDSDITPRHANLIADNDPLPRLLFGDAPPDSEPVTMRMGRRQLTAYRPTTHPQVFANTHSIGSPIFSDPRDITATPDDTYRRWEARHPLWLANGTPDGVPEWRLAAISDNAHHALDARDPATDTTSIRPNRADTPPTDYHPTRNTSSGLRVLRLSPRVHGSGENFAASASGSPAANRAVWLSFPVTATVADVIAAHVLTIHADTTDLAWSHALWAANEYGLTFATGSDQPPTYDDLDPNETYHASTYDLTAGDILTPGTRVAVGYHKTFGWAWCGRVTHHPTHTPLTVHAHPARKPGP